MRTSGDWEVGIRNADWKISGYTPYTCVCPGLHHCACVPAYQLCAPLIIILKTCAALAGSRGWLTARRVSLWSLVLKSRSEVSPARWENRTRGLKCPLKGQFISLSGPLWHHSYDDHVTPSGARTSLNTGLLTELNIQDVDINNNRTTMTVRVQHIPFSWCCASRCEEDLSVKTSCRISWGGNVQTGLALWSAWCLRHRWRDVSSPGAPPGGAAAHTHTSVSCSRRNEQLLIFFFLPHWTFTFQ